MKSTKEMHSRLSAVLISMGANAAFVEELFRDYVNNPASVTESWREFFAAISEEVSGNGGGTAATPAVRPTAATAVSAAPSPALTPAERENATPIRGVAAKIVQHMEASLSLPLASSQRLIPVKVIDENRRVINQYLEVTGKGKVSYTHIIGWAIRRPFQFSKNSPTDIFKN